MHVDRILLAIVCSTACATAQCLDVPGPSGYVAVPASAALAPQGGVTVEAWVVSTPSASQRPTIIRKNPTPFQESYNLRIEFGYPQWSVFTAGGNNQVWPFTAVVPTNTPVHLAGTWDGVTARLYMDGVLLGSTSAFPGPMVDNGGELRIGRGDDNGSEDFIGRMDAVRVWDHARSACQIGGGRAHELTSSPGLIGSWNLDGNATDATANALHGATVGTTAFGAEFTPFAQSLGLAAAPDHVRVPHSAQLVPATGITVEAWIVQASSAEQRPTIVRKNPLANQDSYNLRIEFGYPQWTVFTAGGGNTVWPFTVFIPTDTPVHLAGTWDGTTARLYMDGALIGSTSSSPGPMVDTGGELRIGRGDDGGGENFVGRIDAVRIWSFARTGADIAATVARDIAATPGLTASWTFDGNALDQSGNGHHGTLQGAASYASGIGTHVGSTACAALAFGTSSSTCARQPQLVVSSLLEAPLSFTMGCVAAPPTASGAVLIASARLAVPFSIVGFDLWLDPSAPLFLSVPVGSGADGTSFLPLALTAMSVATLPPISFQYLWIDPCGAAGITASGGMELPL